jgi:hypothetical protein
MKPKHGRRNDAKEFLDVVVDLPCDRGHKVGTARMYVPPDPQAGQTHIDNAIPPDADGRGVRWEDTESGGKLILVCECGSERRVRWSRVLDRLRELETRRNPHGTL